MTRLCALTLLLAVSLPLLANQETSQRYLLVRDANRSKIEKALNAAGTQGFAWVGGDSGIRIGFAGLPGVALVLRRIDNTTHAYKVLQPNRNALQKELAEAGSQGFKLLPDGILQGSQYPTLVLERQPGGAPVTYTTVRVKDNDQIKSEGAINDARRKGAAIVGLMRISSDFDVILEGGAPAANDDRRYRIISIKRQSTLERELSEAATEGFRLILSSKTSILLERPADDAVRREYRLVATTRATTAVRELTATSSEGFRIVDVPPMGGTEFTFVLERTAGARERYEYRIEPLQSEEQFDAQMSAAELDDFRPSRVIERFVLFERTIVPGSL